MPARAVNIMTVSVTMAMTFAVGPVFGATGDILLEYDSALGTLPDQQQAVPGQPNSRWQYEAHCLTGRCPSHPQPPAHPGEVTECWYQGENGNDCTLGHGCGPDVVPAFTREHYNAPIEPLGISGGCSYTEWVTFDNGDDFLGTGFPVALPNRNLTFGPGFPATYWGMHCHPAFGAPGFLNAPTGHAPLRISTGGGVPFRQTLPASSGNNRNLGKLKVRGDYTIAAGVTAVTLVTKLACGNRDKSKELFQFCGLGRRFAVGVDGEDGSPTLGRFGYGTTDSTRRPMFDATTVQVALSRQNIWGPHQGEFFTIRVVLRKNGTVTAWLNEDGLMPKIWSRISGTGSETNVQFHPDEQAGVMWIDYATVLEGDVPPNNCADPVFDINFDHLVNGVDLADGATGFSDCATGPAPAPGVFEALPSPCRCHDVNHDRAIDMRDFAVFQRCLTTGDGLTNQACDD